MTSETPRREAEKRLVDRRYRLLFGVRRSVRYHNYRRQHYLSVQSFISFAIVILGSGSVAKLFTVTESSGISWFDLAAPVAITILASAGLVYGPTGKASLHFDLYRRFINLEKEFLSRDLSDQELDRLEGLRLEIELDEPATYQALDRLCHNELLKSEGRYELMLDLGLWHRLWMGFWRFDDLPKSQGQNS